MAILTLAKLFFCNAILVGISTYSLIWNSGSLSVTTFGLFPITHVTGAPQGNKAQCATLHKLVYQIISCMHGVVHLIKAFSPAILSARQLWSLWPRLSQHDKASNPAGYGADGPRYCVWGNCPFWTIVWMSATVSETKEAPAWWFKHTHIMVCHVPDTRPLCVYNLPLY